MRYTVREVFFSEGDPSAKSQYPMIPFLGTWGHLGNPFLPGGSTNLIDFGGVLASSLIDVRSTRIREAILQFSSGLLSEEFIEVPHPVELFLTQFLQVQ